MRCILRAELDERVLYWLGMWGRLAQDLFDGSLKPSEPGLRLILTHLNCRNQLL